MWAPMQLTARLGFMSVAEVLWRQGKADVNRTLRDEGGLTWTTLSIAASRNRLDMCKLLLRGRARVYPTNEDGRQAVWFAARDGYSAVTMALIEGGGNAGMADVDGLTPALAAALYGHADTVKRILRYQVAERREDLEAKERQKVGGPAAHPARGGRDRRARRRAAGAVHRVGRHAPPRGSRGVRRRPSCAFWSAIRGPRWCSAMSPLLRSFAASCPTLRHS